jgi:type II secretory pathway component PulK
MVQPEYVPGVCNIGHEEIARRRRFGWVALIVALLLVAVLIRMHVNPWWRLLVFLPAAMSASGFLQAQFHFCLGFAYAGISNFGALGQSEAVTDKASRTTDRKRGTRIAIYAVVIGTVAGLLSVFV